MKQEMKMKKLFMMTAIVALIGIHGLASPMAPGAFTVSTNSVSIAPDRSIDQVPTYANGVTQEVGQIVMQGSSLFWCITGGVCSNVTLSSSADTTSGEAVYRRIPVGAREGVSISNIGTSTVYLAVGYPAVSGSGVTLPAGSTWLSIPAPIWSIQAIGTTTDGSVTVQDW
jgi:hypothetical protein